jgi:hypothetical protein
VRVGRAPNDPQAHYWQEVAASNRMPDLINTCIDAGLDIRPLARDIRRLNDERNYRTHDDPQRRIDAEQARRALDLARQVGQRVNAAIKGQRAVVVPPPTPQYATSNGRTPMHNHYRPAPPDVAPVSDGLRPIAPQPTASAVATATASPAPAADVASEDDETPSTEDTGIFPALGTRRRRVTTVLTRGLLAAGLLVVGTGAGLGLAVPLAHGNAPGWLSFTHGWYASAPTARTSQPLVPSTAAHAVGDLLVSAPVCQGGKATLLLRDTGTAALAWSVSNADEHGAATFAASGTTTPQARMGGTLAPHGQTTISAASASTAPYEILVAGPGGAIKVLAPTC